MLVPPRRRLFALISAFALVVGCKGDDEEGGFELDEDLTASYMAAMAMFYEVTDYKQLSCEQVCEYTELDAEDLLEAGATTSISSCDLSWIDGGGTVAAHVTCSGKLVQTAQ